MTDFRKWLSEAVEEISGQAFHIFQDVDDESGIALGKKWQKELDRMLDEARFFLPILTPKFFASRPCRDELAKFLDLERRSGREDLILPIYWIDCPVLEEFRILATDNLAQTINARQRWDWRELRFERFEQPRVQRELASLARQIERARNAIPTFTSDTLSAASGSETGGAVHAASPLLESERLSDPAGPLLGSVDTSLSKGTVFRDVDYPWCPEMVVVPSGSFMMGSHNHSTESPQHLVTFERSFALGRYPVTVGEFKAFLNNSGHAYPYSYDRENDRHPATAVNHLDAEAFMQWLSKKTGEEYQLPSEAMWEYACRAGAVGPFWTGKTISPDQANYNGRFPDGIVKRVHDPSQEQSPKQHGLTDVGSFLPNPFGLHDMCGNVWERCADRWHDNYHGAPHDGSAWLSGSSRSGVMRGGSYRNDGCSLLSAARHKCDPVDRGPVIIRYGSREVHRYLHDIPDTYGFRCARIIN